ncbi:MAG: class I SAM-dependent methyltransferase, partial [Streptomyces sp.]|nr:class I SAM-dependent methyltransferase [Streptomyces sp.]
ATSVSSNPDAYVYLAESIRDWPDQQALRSLVESSGWERCSVTNLTGGIAAIHLARRPA